MPVDNNFYLNRELRPILLPGQTARLYRAESSYEDIEVISVFPLGIHRHDFGDITGDLLNQDDTHLDMPDGEMAQYRYIPRDGFEVHLQHPGGVDMYRTNGSVKGNSVQGFFIRQYDIEGEPWDEHDWAMWMLSEFLVFEDETPRFDIYPPVRNAEMRAHVDFYGIGYSLKKAVGRPPVDIWMNNRPAAASLNARRRTTV